MNMMFIEIEEKKMNKLSEHIEESLKHMGKAMQCVDEWMEEGGMSGGYSGRGGYGNRYSGGSMVGRYGMGYKDNEDEWDDDEMMGERRGRRRRDSRGRYY